MNRNPDPDMSSSRSRDLWLLVLTALAVRAVLAQFYPPLVADDTWSYYELADRIARLDFSNYLPMRTPVYPLLLFLCNNDPGLVTASQHLLGILLCLMLYSLFRRVFRNRIAGLLAGLSYALNPSQVVMERALLTETLSAFLVTGGLLALVIGLETGRNRYFLLAGAVAGLAALTRPAFLFFVPLCVGLAFLVRLRVEKTDIVAALRRTAAAALPAGIIIGGWMVFNYAEAGYMGVSSLGGYTLINHTGAWIEKAPPGYETVRDIYIRHRTEQVRLLGDQADTIYRARKELMSATGLDELRLSQKLMGLSWRLILIDPVAYTASAARAIALFFRPAWITGEGGVRAVIREGSALSRFLLISYMCIYLVLCAGFIILPLTALLPRLRSIMIRVTAAGPLLWTVYLVVWGTALFQGLTSLGPNSRYKQPVEPLILAVGLYLVWLLAGRIVRVWRPDTEAVKE